MSDNFERYYRFPQRLLLPIFFVLGLSVYLVTPEETNVHFVRMNLLIVLVATIIFVTHYRTSMGGLKYVSIAALFLLSYFVTHMQMPLLYALGMDIINDTMLTFVWADLSIAGKSVGISSLGVLAFYVGYSFSSARTDLGKDFKSFRAKSIIRSANFSVILIAAYFFYVLFFVTSGSYKYGAYGVGDQLIVNNYLATGFESLLSAAVIIKIFEIMSGNGKNVSFTRYVMAFGLPLNLLFYWNIAFSIFVGDRGPVIFFLIMYFSIYFIRFSTFRFFHAAAVLLASSLFFTIVGEVRSRTFDVGYLQRAAQFQSATNVLPHHMFGRNVPLSSTLELALSARTLNHSVYNVPKNYDHTYGTFQIQQIVSVVPGLSRLYLDFVHGGSRQFEGSATFISYLIQGDQISYGDGNSPTADLYLDFGVFGVIFGFLIFGNFAGRADVVMLKGGAGSTLFWIAALVYLSGSIYLGRATFLYYLQHILFIYTTLLLSSLVTTEKNLIRNYS